jgi:hypothetical protein
MSAVVETGLTLTRSIPPHAAVRLAGQPKPDPLQGWDTEREHAELPEGTRFDVLTDPRDVGPPSTHILRLADGTYYRVYAEYVLCEPGEWLDLPRPAAFAFYGAKP